MSISTIEPGTAGFSLRSMAATTRDGFRVEVGRSFSAIRPVWDSLALTGVVTPYQHYGWVESYFRVIEAPAGASPALVLIRDGAGEPAMLLPFSVTASRLGRVARFIGGKHANFHMPLIGRGAALLTAADLRAALKEVTSRNAPIERRKAVYADAVKLFEEHNLQDKANLLKFRNPAKVVVYSCEGYTDLAHGPLAHTSGAITHVDLIHVSPGFVIQFPDRSIPPRIPALRPQPLLFQVFQEHKKWGRILNVNTVGRLNEMIAKKESPDFIRIAEALHEKKIAKIADKVKEERARIKFITIAGPSSSGKTTFAKRLSVQLRVNGLNPVAISVDNYFVDRDKTPRDENGDFDFEHIEAIDLELFNQHLSDLVAGQQVNLPRFNFEKGLKEFPGDFMQLEGDQVIILEGIHCLNPRLTASIAPENKFKIYISALTQLNLDSHNRVSTTDNRLVRRLVRDNQFRGHSALTTMKMWPSVRRGEKSWIFPFQQEADIAFNSALDYELAVLKPFAEPLLAEVKPAHPQYAEARRLQDFLGSFLGIPHDLVPPTSILREFIGKSSFRY